MARRYHWSAGFHKIRYCASPGFRFRASTASFRCVIKALQHAPLESLGSSPRKLGLLKLNVTPKRPRAFGWIVPYRSAHRPPRLSDHHRRLIVVIFRISAHERMIVLSFGAVNCGQISLLAKFIFPSSHNDFISL